MVALNLTPILETKMHSSEAENKRPTLRLPEERVAELLDVALEEFLDKGLEGASLSEMARRAGASKTTFYSRFPSKEKLFVAVMKRYMDEVFSRVSVTLPDDPPLSATLREYGYALASHLSSPRHVSLFRLIVMETPRFPELSRRYMELGAQRSHAVLKTYFKGQIARKRITKRDAGLLAEDFLNQLAGSLRFIIHGIGAGEDIERRVNGAVDVFMRAYGLRRIKER